MAKAGYSLTQRICWETYKRKKWTKIMCSMCSYSKKCSGEPSKPHEVMTFYKLRFLVLERDSFQCKYCGRESVDGAKLHVDHVIPKSKGGEDVLENLITACDACNLGKMDALLSAHAKSKIDNYIGRS